MQKIAPLWLLLCLCMMFSEAGIAQQDSLEQKQFLSYGKIPTWTGVAAQWHTPHAQLHLYDTKRYKGHSTFVVNVLKGCNTFSEFKTLVAQAERRHFVPFFLYDLRSMPLLLNKQSYNWAVLVEDYQFTDPDAAIAQMLLRLCQLIPPAVTHLSSKGIVLLSHNSSNKINSRLAPTLHAQGYATLTIEELRQRTGSRQQQVLNAGTAVGKLVVVNTPEQAAQLLPTDIAVFGFVPLDVPPVAGIITLHPQTPLSHTAILAKNRGTVNVYVPSLANINNATHLVGKMVQLRASGKHIQLQAYRATATPTPSLYNNNNTGKTLPIPRATTALGYQVCVFDRSAPTLLTTENIGTKASNYARLQRLLGSNYVRSAAALGYQAYYTVVAQQAQPYINELLQHQQHWDKATTQRALSNIRQCIMESSVPNAAMQSVRQYAQRYHPYQRLRLRSSTNCEDLPQFNGAGLYQSEGVNPDEGVKKWQKALLRIYASLWNDAAFAERQYFGIDQRQVAMAVLLHAAFDNDNEYANGVLLTQWQAKSGLQVLVNVQADTVSVTNPTTDATAESFWINANQRQITRINSYSDRQAVFLRQANMQPLAAQLADVAKQIHTHVVGKRADYGADVEFKIVCTNNNELLLQIKQARLLKW